MQALFGNDSSFFEIKSQSVTNKAGGILSEDVISFNISEELGKLTTGTLSVKDDDLIYSKLFQNGTMFDLSWGYKKFSSIGSNTGLDLTERTGFQCVVNTPSGSGADAGNIISNFTFYGLAFLDGRKYKVHQSGSKGSLIKKLMGEIGAVTQIVDFAGMSESLTTERPVRQRESSYALLVKLAKEWGANFHSSYTPTGSQIAIFVNPQKMDGSSVKSFIIGATKTGKPVKELYFNYGEQSNVKSYTWKQHIGDSGQGDGTRITVINGRPVFTNMVIKGQSVKTYKLNPDKIRKRFEKSGNIKDKIVLTKELLSAKQFEEVKWAFDECESSTAPQGMGYSVSCDMGVGDPGLTIPMNIIFKKGFLCFY